MTVAVEEKGAGTKVDRAARLFDPGGGRTLDESFSAVWESLKLRGGAHCLVCGGALAWSEEAAGAEEAECGACGSRIE